MSSDARYIFDVKLSKWDYFRMAIHTWARSGLVWILLIGGMTLIHIVFRFASADMNADSNMYDSWQIWPKTGAVLIFIFIGLGVRLLLNVYFFADSRIFDNRRFELGDKSIGIFDEGKTSNLDWGVLARVRSNSKYCYLFVARYTTLTIPRHCFPAHTDWDKFCSYCGDQFQLAKAHAE